MAINAEQLNIILAARDKEFTKAMDRSQRRVERFAKQSQKSLSKTNQNFSKLASVAARIAPAIGGAAILASVKNFTDQMDQIGKKADQIGITTDSLQELRAAAVSAGVSSEKLDSSMERFAKRIGEAAMGTGAAKKVLEEMNIEAADLQEMGLDRSLNLIADRMSKISDPTERAAKAAALFGREGVAMVNMLRNGSSGLDAFRKRAQEAGVVIDEDLIRNAEEAQDRLDFAATVIRAQLATALSDLIPLLVGGAEGFAKLVKNTVAAYEAISEFVNPTSQVETAIDNVVLAMADEIRQSRQLNIQLGKSKEMSVQMAKDKLEEAKARHANASAAIQEARALVLQSPEYKNLQERVNTARVALAGLASPVSGPKPSQMETYEELENTIITGMRAMFRMLDADEDLSMQAGITAENIAKLEAALAKAKDGMVTFGGSVTEPITASDRLTTSTGNLGNNINHLNNKLDQSPVKLQQLDNAFEITDRNLDQFRSTVDFIGDAMEQAFLKMLDGPDAFKDGIRQMARDVIRELYRVYVVQRIVSGITGAFDIPKVGQINFAGGAASGGPVQAGQAYTVGEHGRELFVPQTAGRILSVPQTKAAMSGGGEVTIVQNINVSTGVQQTVRTEIKSLMPQIANSAKAAVLDAKRRGGSYGKAFA